jgi:hypothetical protein
VGRIRTIKPEFFKHSRLFDAELETGLPLRVGFAGLWTCCDREGRFKWRPRELKLDVLPYDDCDFSHVLEALADHGFIVKYEFAVETFGYIPSWKSHQFVNGKEAQSQLPDPMNFREVDASATREIRVEDANGSCGVKERKGNEGKEEREEEGKVLPHTNNPRPTDISLDSNMMARCLCERLNLSRHMGPGSTYMAVYDIAKMESERGGDLGRLCDRMVEAYQTWIEEAPNLEYQWGVAKFFGDGWWDRPSAWPRKSDHSQTDKSARRGRKWEEFMTKESDHATR